MLLSATLAPALALLMQSAPPAFDPEPSVSHEQLQDRPARVGDTIEGPELRTELTRLGRCLQASPTDPAAAERAAHIWLTQVSGADLAPANHCLAMALSEQQRWPESAAAFVAARDALGANQGPYRIRLGTLAGNALLNAGDAQGALDAFASARNDALTAADGTLAADIAADVARAQVALGDLDSAAGTLEQARVGDPANVRAWLLSATLARRTDDLARAQSFIQRAAALDPLDPAIALEAGVIAVLGGREDAARKSWQSAMELAPDGPEAAMARDYLAQLDTP